MTAIQLLALFGTLACVACNGSGDTATTHHATDSGAETGPSDSGLPDSFGDCSADVCEVKLSAFTANPGSIPYCPTQKADLDLSCAGTLDVQTATCGELFVARLGYGFPGDYYQCIYTSDALVGAKWAPDNHKTQIAGTQIPESCTLVPQCARDGGNTGADSG